MKVQAHLTLYKPQEKNGQVIGTVGIQEINMEDVASFEFTENGITIHFNTSPDEFISLRDNDGVGQVDWRGCNLYITRKFLEIDMSK